MDKMRILTLIMLLAPLISGSVTGLFGRYLGRRFAHWFTCLLIAVSFEAGFYMLQYAWHSNSSWDYSIYTWAASGGLNIQLGFLVDKLSITIATVVTFVSLMVHVYSIGYMHDDPGYQRFFSYISLFTFGMLLLVLANNLVQLFFGWEAVGLMSYLLIGFWFKRPTATFAGLKAFIINRIGDLGFVLGIAATLYYCGAIDYAEIFAVIPKVSANHQSAVDLIAICLFIGGMAKSAQIPLHVWLPDSMEGPTPISALIHAATMVTAGVFMVARLSPVFEYSDLSLSFITIIGALTCFVMGILGVVQSDIKRIIAYSTLSQLGYMVVALGVSAYSAGILHLITHAFYKALLFLAAGSVIMALHHEQNIFQMGNLRKLLPITFATMLIGTLALIGFPGFAGFYSKDLIIDSVAVATIPGARFAYYCVILSVFVTSLYSFRLLFIVFFQNERTNMAHTQHAQESPKVITWPLIFLAIPSIFIGGLLLEKIMHGYFGNALFVLPQHVTQHVEIPTILHGFVSAPFWLALLGAITAWYCYLKNPQLPITLAQRLPLLYKTLMHKFGFDWLYEKVIMPAVDKLSLTCWRIVDVLLIDGLLVNGGARSVGLLAMWSRKLQSGYLYHYVFAIITGLLVLMLWLLNL